MKTFFSWCAANVGMIGLLLSVLVIAITCWLRIEELRYLGYVPILLWVLSLILIWPGKTNEDILVRFFIVFGSLAYVCFASFSELYNFNPETIAMVKSTLLKMTVIGAFIALEITIYVYRNFSEVVSRRMLYRNSSVGLFDIRLKYSIHQFFESFVVTASIVLLLITCIEIKPTVEAMEAGNKDYWTVQIVQFVRKTAN